MSNKKQLFENVGGNAFRLVPSDVNEIGFPGDRTGSAKSVGNSEIAKALKELIDLKSASPGQYERAVLELQDMALGNQIPNLSDGRYKGWGAADFNELLVDLGEKPSGPKSVSPAAHVKKFAWRDKFSNSPNDDEDNGWQGSADISPKRF